MANGYHLDTHPQANVAAEHYAVIRAPRLKRDRVPESSVTIVASREEAMAKSDITKHLYPARVIGPARSSEGFNLYYIKKLY